MITVLIIYLAFRLKQFVCDFLLQTSWMAYSKGLKGIEGYKPLFAHTAIHALATTAIVLFFAPGLWWLGVVDFVIHSVIDRLKGRLTDANQWKPDQRVFWIAYGFDQEAHNITHLIYVIMLAEYMDIIGTSLFF